MMVWPDSEGLPTHLLPMTKLRQGGLKPQTGGILLWLMRSLSLFSAGGKLVMACVEIALYIRMSGGAIIGGCLCTSVPICFK